MASPAPEAVGRSETEPAPRERPRPRVTLRTLSRMAAEGRPFSCLTAYDFTTARWLDRGGVDVLLVGDSAANVVLGHPSTIHAPLNFLIELTAAVRRGAERAMVMADMPFMSYHGSPRSALRNAGRFMTRGHADVVKLELDRSFAGLVETLTAAGIPVCAHIGSRPQTAALTSGPRAAGRTPEDAERLVEDARALTEAGAVLLLVEAVPPGVAEAVMAATDVAVIGIGAGPSCHGQIMVVNDLLGLTDHPPRFAEPAASLGPQIRAAAEAWAGRVAERRPGGKAYEMAGSG